MALGSSAPEILLSVLETVGGLGQCPGELGASTIVGSAAFNLLVISAVSIYAVNEANDTDPERDSSVPVGVKKIYDMGVFSITAVSSIFAYLWLWYCLLDQQVSMAEAWWTLGFFFILVLMSFGADRYKASQVKEEVEDDKPVIEFSAMDIYRTLINEKNGQVNPEDKQKSEKMKKFLKDTLKTDQIEQIQLEELKKVVEGDKMLSRIQYRRQVGNMMAGKRPVVGKGEVMKLEHAHAEHIDEKLKNAEYGFKCLHYSVSEASGSIKIAVVKKKPGPGRVRVATIDAEAKAGEDFKAVDEVLNFKSDGTQFISVEIFDDENWEPDEDFFVQMFDPESNAELVGQDCKTRVTIIDDDKPGQICFEQSGTIKAVASDEFAEIVIIRKNGSDGVVTVDYETQELGKTDHTATPGKDYHSEKGTLRFEQGET